MKNHSLDSVYMPLKITFGLLPLLSGLDKFIGLLADWQSYLSPWVLSMLPFSGATFMMIVGVIEVIVGVAILTKFTRLGAYVAMGWLILISLNLLLVGAFDVAVRDLVIAVGAYTLGTVAGLKELKWLPGLSRTPETVRSDASTDLCACGAETVHAGAAKVKPWAEREIRSGYPGSRHSLRGLGIKEEKTDV